MQFASDGHAALVKKNYTLAEELLKESETLNGSPNGFTTLDLARVYDAQGRTKDALPLYKWLTHPELGGYSSFEHDPAILMRSAALHAQAGDLQESAYAYEKALANSPANSPLRITASNDPTLSEIQAAAHITKGIDLWRWGAKEQDQQAVEEFKRAVRIAPNMAAAQYNLGEALQKLGRNAEAQSAFEEAAKLTDDPALKQKAKEGADHAGSAASYQKQHSNTDTDNMPARVSKGASGN